MRKTSLGSDLLHIEFPTAGIRDFFTSIGSCGPAETAATVDWCCEKVLLVANAWLEMTAVPSNRSSAACPRETFPRVAAHRLPRRVRHSNLHHLSAHGSMRRSLMAFRGHACCESVQLENALSEVDSIFQSNNNKTRQATHRATTDEMRSV